MSALQLLVLEPYHGGSHRAFLDGWAAASRHTWTRLTLPARKWTWRMRHAAVTFAEELADRHARGERWDVLLASDMLNLAELKGLLPARLRPPPAVLYFHENQVTYPQRRESERDWHYGFINMTSALAADAVWFNSSFHRDAFLQGLESRLRRMPDHRPLDACGRIRARSRVEPPGIDPFPARGPRPPGPLRAVWAARWEHDKDPETLFAALETLKARRVPFRASVLGERFREAPPVFARSRVSLADHLDHFGHLPSRDAYRKVLQEADVFVSTARHEFFGLSAAEAMAAGARPLLPHRLSYPELLRLLGAKDPGPFLYNGDAADLARRMEELAAGLQRGALWPGDPHLLARGARQLSWQHRAPHLDNLMEQVAARRQPPEQHPEGGYC